MSDLLKSLEGQAKRAAESIREYARTDADKWTGEIEESYKRANAEYDRLVGLRDDESRRIAKDAEWAAAADAAGRANGDREIPKPDADRPLTWRESARQALKEERTASGGCTENLPDIAREFRPTTRHQLAHRIDLERRTTLNVTTGGQGPEVVDQTLVDTLFEKVFDDATIFQSGATILRTGTGEALKFPRLATLGTISQANARRAESATVIFGEPTLDQVTFNAFKYAQGSKASREVIEDAVINIESLMGQVQGRNLANYLGQDLMTGTGSGMPRGIVQVVTDSTGTTYTGMTSQTGGLGGSINGDTDEVSKLYSVVHKIKPAYRRNAKWMVNDLTVLALRKIKVNAEANHFAWNDGDATTPDTLLRYPVLIDPYMPTIALNAYSIIFGDWSQYYIRLVNGVRVEWSTEFAWVTDEVACKSVLRADGDAIDDAAFASFRGGAS